MQINVMPLIAFCVELSLAARELNEPMTPETEVTVVSVLYETSLI
jgi:hypothetical protein